MTFIVPLLAATGLLLLYAGLTGPAPRERQSERLPLRRRASEELRALVLGSAATPFIALVVAGFTGSFTVACSLALVTPAVATYTASERAKRRRRAVSERWPEVIDVLVSGLRAGMSLPQACAELAENAPEPMRPLFRKFHDEMSSGRGFVEALAALRAEAADPVADRIMLAFEVAHDVGGPELIRSLRSLSDQVHGDLRLRKEIHSRWSWNVTAARLAASAPPLVLLLMAARPEGSRAFSAPGGMVVIAVGAMMTISGYLLMLRIARLPEEARVR